MTQLPGPAFDGLYGDLILDHFRNPRNRNPLGITHIEAHELNPFCGDRVDLQIQLAEDGRVREVCALSEGCSIIQASASMMSNALRGRSLEEIDDLGQRFHSMMRAGRESPPNGFGELDALAVVREYPVRIKCALLPWTALEIGLDGYRNLHGLTG
jgi:nitrogen fixation NifU-like protein